MKKRFLSLFLALCMIVGLLPSVAMPHAHAEGEEAEVTSATVTLWGTEFTVDTDETNEIPEALYWFNAEYADPTEATAEDEWNYSFTIVNGVPTLTLRNAVYRTRKASGSNAAYNKNFLTVNGYVGEFEVRYEGTGNIFKFAHNNANWFISYTAGSLSFNDNTLKITGAEDAVLNLEGAGNNKYLIVTGATGRQKVVLSGGEMIYKRTSLDFGFIHAPYSELLIQNCTLTCTSTKGGNHPVITAGVEGHGITINNATVTIDTLGCGILAGVFSTSKAPSSESPVVIKGSKSNVTIKVQSTGTKAHSGIGIYADSFEVQDGTVDITASRVALAGTDTTASALVDLTPDLENYKGNYAMYTAADGPAVTQYTSTTYFKVEPVATEPEPEVPACEHTGATAYEAKPATCKEAGNSAYWHCAECNKYFSDETLETVIAEGSWVLPKTEEHTPAEDDGDCTTEIKCTVCGTVTTEAKGDHTGGTATCSALAKCEICSKEYGQLDANNHKYTNYVSDNNATYNKDGTKTAFCDYDCGAKDTVTDEGSMLPGAVAEANGVKYGTLAEALAAGGEIKLLTNASIDAETVLTAGNTYIIPAGLTLTVNAKVTAEEGAILNCYGTIVVNAATDISKLVYGKTFGACGGKLTVKANGSVAMLDEWVGVWTPINDAKLGAMLKDCETGATITVGTQNWQLAESGWEHLNHVGGKATCKELAECEICGKTYGKLAEHTYDDEFDAECNVCDNVRDAKDAVAQIGETDKYGTLAEALTKAEAGQTVTLLENVTVTAFVNINKAITLDLGGKTISRVGNTGAATVLYTTAEGVTITNGTVSITDQGSSIWVAAGTTITNVTAAGADVGLMAHAPVTVTDSTISASAITASESGDGIRAYNGAVITLDGTTTVVGSTSGSAVEVYKGAEVSVKEGAVIAENNVVYGGKLIVYTAAGTISTSGEMAEGVDPESYIEAATIEIGKFATVGQITLNNEDATVIGAEDLDVVATLGDKVWYNEGKHVVHTHTKEEIPAAGATCTETGLTAGVKCSVCDEILTAQKEIPAIGHKWTEEGTCANGCEIACPVIEVNGNKVNVVWDGDGAVQMHFFYLGNKVTNNEVNPTKWRAVWNAAENIEGSPYGNKGRINRTSIEEMNAETLNANGDFVLFLSFVDANGDQQSISKYVAVNVLPETILGEDGRVQIQANEYQIKGAFIFYLEKGTTVETGKWSKVRAAAESVADSPYGAAGYKSYKEGRKITNLDNMYLPEIAGTYVVFVNYIDENGETKQISETFVVD